MWVLESEGEFLGGKKLWLRPGKKYLFGRTIADEVSHTIVHSTISRKHLVLEVFPVEEGQSSHLDTRSKIVVTDQDSKHGTRLDGEQIRGQSQELSKPENELRIGKYEHALRINWIPCILTFSLSSKEMRQNDPLATRRSRIEELDLKISTQFHPQLTTHVISSKRNVAKGLQALTNGAYIVTEAYIDAIVYAATPDDLDSLENLSPLERNFDASWPDPAAFLPPPGKEPNPKPAEAYLPRKDRGSVFDGYTFVFGDETQFNNLQDAIWNGHGKALLFEMKPHTTTAAEVVDFLRTTTGSKGLGELPKGVKGGCILVRNPGTKGAEEWFAEVENDVAIQTDQRVVRQNEFLDAILDNDARPLRRALEAEPESERSLSSSAREPDSSSKKTKTPRRITPEPPSPPANPSPVPEHEQEQDQDQEEAPPRPKPRVRARPKTKLKTFDDGFDMEAIPEYSFEDDMEGISQAPDNEDDNNVEQTTAPPSRSTRSHDVSHHVNSSPEPTDNNVSSLLPASTAMKKRMDAIQSRHPKRPLDPPPVPAPKPKKVKREIDVREAARQRREAQDEAANADMANLRVVFEGEDIESIRNLAVVEEMEIVPREGPGRVLRDDDVGGERWDPRWNGRKNFKKFVRSRDGGAAAGAGGGRRAIRVQAVIVPLEEVRKKGFGMGDEFWGGSAGEAEESQSQRRSRASSRGVSQGQSASAAMRRAKRRNDEDDDVEMGTADDAVVGIGSDNASASEDENYWAQRRAQKAKTHKSRNASRAATQTPNTHAATASTSESHILVPSSVQELEDEAMQITGEAIDVDEPRTTRHGHDVVAVEAKKTKAKTTTAAKGRTGSNLRQSRLGQRKERDEDHGHGQGSDSDDGLKFRFRRKRGA